MAISTSRPAEPSRRFWPVAVLAALAVTGLALLASRSPLFAMRSLEVSGHAHLSREAVARVGGLGARTNVLWMSPGEVEARLEADPWIARASVARELPGRVTVRIIERSPVAAVRLGGSSWVVIAGDGTALERRDADPGLPRLVARGGDTAVGDDGHLSRALLPGTRAVGSMSAWLRARVRAVVLAADGSLVIRLRGGAVADYGAPSELGIKAGSLEAVLRWADVAGARLDSIDLRAPRAPAALRPPRSRPTVTEDDAEAPAD